MIQKSSFGLLSVTTKTVINPVAAGREEGAHAPGRQQKEAPKEGTVIFCDTKYTKILLALLRQGWAWKDKSCA